MSWKPLSDPVNEVPLTVTVPVMPEALTVTEFPEMVPLKGIETGPPFAEQPLKRFCSDTSELNVPDTFDPLCVTMTEPLPVAENGIHPEREEESVTEPIHVPLISVCAAAEMAVSATAAKSSSRDFTWTS
ncbi:MAG TPA: hypothetical protein VKU62_05030 [Thermoanaerobaculia bacterium]|nr:hypothetical protein [Thermoanaerobaculia bacterium]